MSQKQLECSVIIILMGFEKKRSFWLKAFFVLACLTITGDVFAISLPNNAIGQTISITSRPEYPAPLEKVTLSLSSPSFDVSTAEISWVLNGVVSAKGTGIKNYSFQMGQMGSRARFDIVIKPRGRDSFTQSFVIFPTSIDLFWQANTYTPPLFKGKAMHTTEGPVTIVAMPHIAINGKVVPKENLVYQWTQNGQPLTNSSGFGKNSVIIRNSFTRTEEEVGVTVSTSDKSIFSKKEIVVPVKNSEIIFYENHPLYGPLLNSAIGREITLMGKEMSFTVAPYFFAVSDPANERLVYTWLINGGNNQAGDSRDKLTFRNESNDSGQTRVGLKITDSVRVISYAENNFLINYSNNQN